jgi:hypothetical protein
MTIIFGERLVRSCRVEKDHSVSDSLRETIQVEQGCKLGVP